MRTLMVGVALILGCGGSGLDPDLLVVDLTLSEQEDLCESFLDDICADPALGSFCDDPCIRTGCRAAAENGEVDNECPLPITVGDVDDCAVTADPAVCQRGGGCLFDALEAVCP